MKDSNIMSVSSTHGVVVGREVYCSLFDGFLTVVGVDHEAGKVTLNEPMPVSASRFTVTFREPYYYEEDAVNEDWGELSDEELME